MPNVQSTDEDLEKIIYFYKEGLFPMGDHRNKEKIFWCNPLFRAIIPISRLHISRSLKRFCKKKALRFSINKDFITIISKCADRKETWINSSIISIYNSLHEYGYAHSIEIWEKEQLIGGLYGVAIGKVFFAESMFSESSNGSKIALIALMGILAANKFVLLDVQFITDHLKSMGAIEISRALFLKILKRSTSNQVEFKTNDNYNIDMKIINEAEKNC